MNRNHLIALVNDAVDQLYRKDSSLIRREVHEVTISHRLAVYLEQLLWDRGEFSYDVDIEYNRNMAGQKRLVPREKGKRPDIIVHRRESNDHNLLIVEMKKNRKLERNSDDDRKLRGATSPNHEFRYTLGVYLNITGTPTAAWYVDGEIMTEHAS